MIGLEPIHSFAAREEHAGETPFDQQLVLDRATRLEMTLYGVLRWLKVRGMRQDGRVPAQFRRSRALRGPPMLVGPRRPGAAAAGHWPLRGPELGRSRRDSAAV